MRGRSRVVAVAVASALFAGALGATGGRAEAGGGGSLPTYEGFQFPPIHSAADPEAYSWRVSLGSNQTLRAVSETEAAVEYPDGLVAFAIVVEKAHDATQATVPTTLEVSEGEVLTVVVHHLEGAYVYPVTPGEGSTWNGETTIIKGPLDEKEIEEARRRVEEANRAAAIASTPAQSLSCKVPALQGLSLAAAKAHLRAAHCSVGQVHLAVGATAGKGKVVKQFRAAGTELLAGMPVALKLGSR
jgi:hypothetical protein